MGRLVKVYQVEVTRLSHYHYQYYQCHYLVSMSQVELKLPMRWMRFASIIRQHQDFEFCFVGNESHTCMIA